MHEAWVLENWFGHQLPEKQKHLKKNKKESKQNS